MNKVLAIFSPNQYSYSETFIQAHKNLAFNIKFYYGGTIPCNLESSPSLFHFKLGARIKKRFKTEFSLSEHALMNSLKKEKVDCILAEYGPTACLTLKIIEYLKLPLVVHFHGFDATNKDVVNEYALRYKKMFDYASAVIAVSNKMKADLIALGCPEKKLVVTPCGPNPNFLKVTPAFINKQFVTVGRFIEIKGPFLTILAFKKVVDVYPQALLVMIGDGQLLNTCKYLARSLHLTNNISFKGVLNPSEIMDVFEESSAFLQHCITLEGGVTEGTPVSVMEAQAAALPVISTYHAGIPDIVIHNATGLLAKEFDIDTMATNMLRILEEDGLAQKLGMAGRKRIIDHFSMDKHLTVLQTVISNSISEKNSISNSN